MNATAWIDSAPPGERALGRLAWPAALCLTLLLAIASGGSSQADSALFLLFRLLCLGLFGAALLRLAGARLALSEALALAIAGAAVALICLQLIPLPYALFAGLPGRDFVAKVFSIAGIAPQAMPMTLDPGATRACLLTLLPPLALLLASMATQHRQLWYLAGAVLAGAGANVLLGLAQRFQGVRSGLYLYEITNYGSATGFFSNRNNFAMLLCVAIPLLWATAHKVIRMRLLSPPAGLAAGGVMMLIIFMGLAASNSRSGILLGMLALTLSTLMVMSVPAVKSRSSRQARRGRMLLFAVLGGAFVIGQFGMTGILRIVESDPLSDYRSAMRGVTLQAAADYFPIGSGFGTFTRVYAMHETPATMISAYVNHAHNDWLELWLEGGVPAAALMAGAVALFLYQGLRVWNPRGPYAEHVLPRAASIGMLVLMLHSLVEFPLRMPALAAIFGALVAIMMAPPPHRHLPHGQRGQTERRRSAPEDDEDGQQAPTPVAPPVFRVTRGDGIETRRGPR